MSAFKSILVPVEDEMSAAIPLDTALRLAGRFSAHVTALHVRADPTNAVPLVGEGMSGAMVEEMIGIAETQGAQRAKLARAAFDTALARNGAPLADAPPVEGLSAEWIEVVGREEDVITWRGRVSDLVVFGHPGGEAEVSSLITLNTALMACGRPLLLCPAEPAPLPGSNVCIAWNGSAEAARAVGFAMPFLKGAASVTILTVAEHAGGPAPAGDLETYLAWNGIAAGTTVIQAPSSHAGEELVRQTRKVGADLLVMGAYTHSRLRQLILGGVTRHVISHAPLHVLMCH
ncbi:universal stress protein [Paramagnetospirillum magneticum]|uniref:Universal stress protein UspA and related nucleotide-binding protein n=1 Tax=Paramagnetospirillum magneticum (strain ATCC 700264 / AMB-1) TaxID=342108 RepID=Q2W742_PARM1|nr:universal stress protein [Paramagnetospirillum magneticum]BAE50333.1 Universal stress protein UspA and related nucleotide-binding protein [Paramagnetospirillum magneticum AMB-1]